MTRGERIAARRKEIGLTQVDLAEAIGESKQTIYKYETGIVTNIPLDKLEAIAKALKCPPEELAGWTISASKADLVEEGAHASPEELTPTQQRAMDLIKTMSDDDLRKFISMGEILKGGK